MPLPELFATVPEPLAAAFEAEAPWTLLGDPLEAVLAALPSSAIEIAVDPDCHLVGDRIAIGSGTRIHPGAVIQGPIRIGRDCDIRPGAFLRGGCWLGDGCTVGASSEVKHSILLDGAKAPHLNYVGDSILGADVNLGAGTVLSNLRHDGREILLPLDGRRVATGRRKLGAVLGDGVKTGCNCVLNPGVVVGAGSQIHPLVSLRSGSYPAGSIVKLRQAVELVSARRDHPGR